ncbi:hypothetical protein [Phaeobacter piscinae]|uniref:hypothetical protein n=1 Tax=Phaeobacter piscinae TaxID=1580596 RepID=UPI000CA2CFF6|nr:hypothetical protein [Phaeobacter piscinae]AUQ75280.1 hypothetical protein PhaeoP71_02433 [Phaeobacter piscinae]
MWPIFAPPQWQVFAPPLTTTSLNFMKKGLSKALGLSMDTSRTVNGFGEAVAYGQWSSFPKDFGNAPLKVVSANLNRFGFEIITIHQ